MKSAREAMIRGGPASVERALLDAAPTIATALRDPRWLPPPAPLSLGLRGDGGAAAAAARGTYAPPADEAEAYRALEAPVRRLRLAREACTALGIGRGRRGGADENEGRHGGEGGTVDDNDDDGDDAADGDESGVPLPLALRVYEASADAAAAMRCADGELLKALSGLCGSIYPALRRQEEQHREAAGAGAGKAAAGRPPSSSPSSPPPLLLAREAEMRAALVLFYACMPARPLPQNLAQCLSAEALAPFLRREGVVEEEQEKEGARPSPATATTKTTPTTRDRRLVRSALRGAAAALSGDWVAFGACYAAMPRVPRHVMARCLPRVRAHTLRCMARCFAPSLPVACAERWLGLRVVGLAAGAEGRAAAGRGGGDRHAPLVALLEEAALGGCRGSAAALVAREAARRARADAVWSGGNGGGGKEGSEGDVDASCWEARADGLLLLEQDDDGDDDDGFAELVFKPPPPSALAAAAAAKAIKPPL